MPAPHRLLWLMPMLLTMWGRAEETVSSPPFMIQIWKMEEGLPQTMLTCLQQSRDGYLWLGSGNGLARFDGRRFTLFNSSTHDFFYRHDIKSIREDRQGTLWIMAADGLFRLRHGQFEDLTGLDGGVRNRHFPAGCLEDGDGNFWVHTGERLLRFDAGTETVRRDFPGIPPGSYCKLLAGPAGRIEAVGQQGLWWFDGTRFHPRTVRNWPAGCVQDALYESDGRLVLAAAGRLWHLDGQDVRPFGATTAAAESAWMKLGTDRRRRLWLFTWSDVYCVEEGRFTKVASHQTNPWKNSHSWLEDSQGNVWIGNARGLFIVTDTRPLALRPVAGLSGFPVLSLHEDRQGNIWAGLYGGLARIGRPRLINFREESGMDCTIPRVLYQSKQGQIWVGGSCGGLTVYENGRFHTITRDRAGQPLGGQALAFEDSAGRSFLIGNTLGTFTNGLFKPWLDETGNSVHMVSSIVEERPGVYWVGSARGLYRLSGQRQELFREEQGLSHQTIYDLHQGRDGTLWICTARGVTWRQGGRFIQPFAGTSLAHKSVMDIAEDEDGTIWLAAYGGLFRYSRKNLFHFRLQHGLCDNDILGLVDDGAGYLWMSSFRGIMRVARHELDELAGGRTTRLHPVRFGRIDGMANAEGNSGQHPSTLRSRDGRLWFPTMGGVAVIDPATVRISRTPPAVHIENLSADGQDIPLPPSGRAGLPAGTRRCRIQFTAIDLTNPRHIYFRYRLEGYEESWNEPEPAGDWSAPYMNLPPGDYSFHVQACSCDGAWNESGARLAFSIAPLYWQTGWFRSLLALTGAAGVWLLASFFRRYRDLLLFWRRRRHVGPYVLEEIAGYGGTATVFRAHRMLKTNEKAAVKILKKEFQEHPPVLKRFRQEAAIVDSLDHPHIVKVFERGSTGENSFIAMEWLAGETLAQRLKRTGPLALPASIRIGRQLAEVLVALHRKGIQHRDLKPANIMLLVRDGQADFVKVLDFGLARSEFHSRITRSGVLLGSTHYLAPERVGSRQDTPAGDIYALGVIIFEMLAGHPPFDGRDELEVLRDILTVPFPSITALRPEVPPVLTELVQIMVAKNPLARPDASHVAHRLAILEEDIAMYEPPGPESSSPVNCCSPV